MCSDPEQVKHAQTGRCGVPWIEARGEEGCCGVATHARGVPAAAAAPAAGRHSREGRSKTGRDVRLTSLRVRRFARGEARLHVCVYAASAAAPAGFRLRRWRLTADRRRAYGEPPRALSHCPDSSGQRDFCQTGWRNNKRSTKFGFGRGAGQPNRLRAETSCILNQLGARRASRELAAMSLAG